MNNNGSDCRSIGSQSPNYMYNWTNARMQTTLSAEGNPRSDTGHHDGTFMVAEAALEHIVPRFNNNNNLPDFNASQLNSQDNRFTLVNHEVGMSLSFRSPPLDLLLEDGMQDLKAENWSSALSIFQQADAFYPNNAAVKAGIGCALEGSDKWAQAIQYFDRAIELADENMDLQDVLAGKGACLIMLKRYEEALPVLIEANTIAPNNFEVLIGLGSCHMHFENWLDAKNAFLKAYLINPHVTKCHDLLGTCYDNLHAMNQRNDENNAALAFRN